MSTPFTASAKRNKVSASGVFVQVPPSPFDLDRYQSLSVRHVPATSSTHNKQQQQRLKENTSPLRASRVNMLQQSALANDKSKTTSKSSSSSSAKRKLADRDDAALVAPTASKKVKSASTGTPLKPSQVNRPFEPARNSCPEYPNGFAYCHQCSKKRDVESTLQCTFLESRHMAKSNAVKEWRCVAKYCKPCLQNRYGEDLEAVKCNKKRESGHVNDAGYYFKCPKCNDTCNCPRCRKSKGLEPIGTMKKSESEKPSASAKESAAKAPATKEKKKNASAPAQQPKKRVAPPKSKPKPKILPAVKWTRIASDLTQDEVEERMHIREFVLRFNELSTAGLLKPQLEELEQINGKYNGQEGQDPTMWVSDVCAKAVVVMLLGLLSGDEAPTYAEASRHAVDELRNAGFSLNKVWSTLLEWQDAVAQASPAPDFYDADDSDSEDDEETPRFSIAEPLPPSPSFIANARRSTRTMASAATTTGIPIYSSAQLIPPILSLIDLTLELPSIHDAIDEGAKEAREVYRKAREAMKIEGERWDGVRKAHEGGPKDKVAFQAARQLHKDILAALERSSEIAQCASMTRFAPLGKDPEGHIYYALAPGHSEREAAAEYADVLSSLSPSASSSKPLKMKRKARTLKPSEREDMHDWSWMILVWGKKPPSAYCPVDEDEDMEMEQDERDEKEERWWCFSDPSDIRDLAGWVAAAFDLEPDSKDGSAVSAAAAAAAGDLTPGQVALKGVVGSLRGFAGLLEWRLGEDKYRLPTPGPVKKNGQK